MAYGQFKWPYAAFKGTHVVAEDLKVFSESRKNCGNPYFFLFYCFIWRHMAFPAWVERGQPPRLCSQPVSLQTPREAGARHFAPQHTSLFLQKNKRTALFFTSRHAKSFGTLEEVERIFVEGQIIHWKEKKARDEIMSSFYHCTSTCLIQPFLISFLERRTGGCTGPLQGGWRISVSRVNCSTSQVTSEQRGARAPEL